MKNKRLSYWIKVSLGVHFILILLFALDINLFQKDLENSLRVDIVGLPDQHTSPQRPLDKPQKTKKPPRKPKQKKKAPSLKTKSQAKPRDQKPESKEAQKELKARTVFKGNILADGQGLEGLDRLSMERYYEEVGFAVRENFITPQWLESQNLSAFIEVTLDDGGKVLKKALIKSSGNEVFDNRAIEAVIKSEPLPTPPDRIKSLFYKINFILKFPE